MYIHNVNRELINVQKREAESKIVSEDTDDEVITTMPRKDQCRVPDHVRSNAGEKAASG